ncbi:hypothetical protein Tco_0421507 [Tanacetum coccineum]
MLVITKYFHDTTEALTTYEANQNSGNGNENGATLMEEVAAREPCTRLVKCATCTILDGALTWWNSHVKTVEIDAAYDMSWRELMKMMTEASDHRGLANSLMDQKVRAIAARQADNKRKWEDEQEGYPKQQQNKRQEMVGVYAAGNCQPPNKNCLDPSGGHAMDVGGKWNTPKKYCPGLKNQNGVGGARQDLNVVTVETENEMGMETETEMEATLMEEVAVGESCTRLIGETVGIDAPYDMSWREVMKMTTELALLCPKRVPDEEEKIERLANSLMDQKVHAITARQADNKRKWEDEQEGYPKQQQNKRQEMVGVYTARTVTKQDMLELYLSVTSATFIITTVHLLLNVETIRKLATKQETVGPLPR